MNKGTSRGLFVAITFLIILIMATTNFAQGRGRGGGSGGGKGSGGGVGNAGGPPAGVGVDRGLGTSSEHSGGRSDTGLANASGKSGGRSDDGLDRARTASNNLRHASDELRNNPGIARTLHTSANDLRSGYQAALLTNPDLKFGQYVAATRLAQNLGSRNPGITRSAILSGLASGRSLGRTLQDLGLNEHDANQAKKQVDREIKKAKQ